VGAAEKQSEELEQFAVQDGGAEVELPKAGKGARFIAALLDAFFSGILSALGATILTKGLGAGGLPITILWNLTFPFLYFVFPIYSSGQTLGKKIMKLKIVNIDPAQDPSMWNIFVRELPGKSIGAICLMLGYVRILTHPDGRAWHDSMAKTRVVSLVEE